jgi:hypothetical protein
MLTYGQIYNVFSKTRNLTRDLFIYYHESGKLQAGGFFNPINVKGANPNFTYTFGNGVTKNIEDVRMCELNEEATLKEESAAAGGSSNVPAAVPASPSNWRKTMQEGKDMIDPKTGKDLRADSTYPYEINSKDAINGEFYLSGFSYWGRAKWVDGVLHLERTSGPDVIVETPGKLWSTHPPPSAGGRRKAKKSRKQRKQKRRSTRK